MEKVFHTLLVNTWKASYIDKYYTFLRGKVRGKGG